MKISIIFVPYNTCETTIFRLDDLLDMYLVVAVFVTGCEDEWQQQQRYLCVDGSFNSTTCLTTYNIISVGMVHGT